MMTYESFIDSINKNPIQAQSDETVEKAVFDWFRYRYIGFEDPNKFLVILQRNVAINYPIYKQKLRIEPGVSKYDWLVSEYRERQLKSSGENSNTQTHGQDTTNKTNSLSFNGSVVGSGNNSNLKTGTQGLRKTGTQNAVRTGGQSNIKSGSDTNVKTGGHTITDKEGTHTRTDSPHISRISKEEGGNNTWSGDSQIQSNLPMSKNYDKFIEVDTNSDKKQYYEKAYQHLPKGGLDWSTATSQAQSGHREYNDTDKTITTSYKYNGSAGDVVTTKGSKTDPDTHETVYNRETDTHTFNKLEDKTVFDNITDKTTFDTSDTTTYNVRDAGEQTSTTTDDHTERGNESIISNYGNINNSGTDNRTDREQVTGRNEDVATLLTRATAFIEKSSAFMWFKEQLDSCFFPGYYTDENEEGSALI